MSVHPIETPTSLTSAPTSSEPTVTTTPTGLASIPTMLESGNPDETNDASRGVFSCVCECVCSAFDSIRKCLTKLPLIGCCFLTERESTILTDKRLVAQIRASYYDTYETAYQSTRSLFPSADEVSLSLDLFRQITMPAAKMEALCSILGAVNSTDDISKQFYATLPVEMQNDFKRQIWLDNRQHDNGHGIGYGDYIVVHDIRGRVAQEAAAHYRLFLQFHS